MIPAWALAVTVVDEWVRNGVTDAVVAPGSRSAPLALALADAASAGRLRLHVRIDERSAGFLALGLSRASGRAVPVVCTSGTATANLHPAVLEASEAGVALVVCTADRPPELRGVGANQTVEQPGLYGRAVRSAVAFGVPEARPGQAAAWRSTVCRAVQVATGVLTGDPGPVHLNVPLREPLVPEPGEVGPSEPGVDVGATAAASGRQGAAGWVEDLDGRPDGAPWHRADPAGVHPAPLAAEPARTLVVVGDCGPELGRRARAWAEACGWPVLAEPSSGGARGGPNAVSAYPVLLGVPGFLDTHRPERVVVAGRPTLGRGVQRLLADPRVAVEVRSETVRWADAARRAVTVAVGLPEAPVGRTSDPRAPGGDHAWLAGWQAAEAAARAAVDAAAATDPGLRELAVAAAVLGGVPAGSVLVAGSSRPVRDLEVAPLRDGVRVVANRGVAGIDGTVSTALGWALGLRRAPGAGAYALLGDLTLLHDANGLVFGASEPRPDLTLVVVNNDGGGIFGLLEQGAPWPPGRSEAERRWAADRFERVFGTPHGVDLASLAAATATPYRRVEDLGDLPGALAPAPGVRLVEVCTERSDLRAAMGRLAAAVAGAVAGA